MPVDRNAVFGEPIPVWEALGASGSARCEIVLSDRGAALHVWWGDELMAAEMYDGLEAARARAAVFRDELAAQGWTFA